jgi:hypothetical protein
MCSASNTSNGRTAECVLCLNKRDNLGDLDVDKNVHIQVGEEKEETGGSSGYAMILCES